MVQVLSTSGVMDESGVNILLYGCAGIGKTRALGGLPSPIILSAEGGLLSLRNESIPYIRVSSVSDLRDAYSWLSSDSVEAREYESVAMDSLSEICDVTLVELRKRVGSEPAVLYPELRQRVLPLLSAFRSLRGKSFVATARESVRQVRRGDGVVGPAVVGNRLADDVPYIFDMVLHYTLDEEGNRVVYTDVSCIGSIAKDRTGVLPARLDDLDGFLAKIIELIRGDCDVSGGSGSVDGVRVVGGDGGGDGDGVSSVDDL